MFTQKCFIRSNSKRVREALYRISVMNRPGTMLWDIEYNTLLSADDQCYRNWDDERGNAAALIFDGYIDCGKNEELFLALAALRDDSDRYQWFCDGDFWGFCRSDKFHDIQTNSEDVTNSQSWKNGFHKATPQEIVEYFKC